MSECSRGYKCSCFQCGEKDCEYYQQEEPDWGEELFIKGDWLISEMSKAIDKAIEKDKR